MVYLSLIAAKGNHGARYFPHSGYLGLSTVKVDGAVRLTLDEDARPLLVRDVTVAVRCYEARFGKAGIVRCNVLFEQSTLLWSKRPELDEEPLSASEWPFKIVIPPKHDTFTSLSLPDYRIFWRLEAAVNHAPRFGLGSRIIKSFDLRLIRYDLPQVVLPPQPSYYRLTSDLHRPSIRYLMSTPAAPVGPTDIVTVELSLKPSDAAVRVHAVNLAVVRSVTFSDSSTTTMPANMENGSSVSIDSLSPPPSPANDAQDTFTFQSSSGSTLASTATLVSSNEMSSDILSISKRSPSLSVTAPSVGNGPAKSTSAQVAHFQTELSVDADGVYKKLIPIALPAPKSSAHWTLGVSMQSTLVTIRFFIRTQILVSKAGGSPESVELEDREIFVVPTNQSERSVAVDKIDALLALSTRSKSKSPASTRSSRRRGEAQEADSVGSSAPSSLKPHRAPRRPHTSSGASGGPRSETLNTRSHRISFNPEAASNGEFPGSASQSNLLKAPPPTSFCYSNEEVGMKLGPRSRTPPRLSMPTALKGITNRTSPYPTPITPLESRTVVIPPSSPESEEMVRDWEEELERIATSSWKRSLEMLRFGRHRFGVANTKAALPIGLSMRSNATAAVRAAS